MTDTDQGAAAPAEVAPVGAELDMTAMRAELEKIRAELAEVRNGQRQKKVRDQNEVDGINHRRSKDFGKLAMAIAQAQGKFSTVKRKNEAQIESRRTGDQYGYKYADLGDFIDMARAPLSEAGIAVIQFPSFESDGQHGWVTVESIVVHGESGQWMANLFEMGTSSLRPQDIGIATTYCRRYAYTAILNMISEREDDDGNKASGNKARFRRDGGDQWDNDEGWQPPGPPADGQHPNTPREQPAKTRQPPPAPAPAASKRPASQTAPAAPAASKKEAPAKTVNTPEEVRNAVRDLKPKDQPKAVDPDERGPNDILKALESFRLDLPDHVGDALEVLQTGYDAQINGEHENDVTVVLHKGTYSDAHAELTKLYRTLKRAARAGVTS